MLFVLFSLVDADYAYENEIDSSIGKTTTSSNNKRTTKRIHSQRRTYGYVMPKIQQPPKQRAVRNDRYVKPWLKQRPVSGVTGPPPKRFGRNAHTRAPKVVFARKTPSQTGRRKSAVKNAAMPGARLIGQLAKCAVCNKPFVSDATRTMKPNASTEQCQCENSLAQANGGTNTRTRRSRPRKSWSGLLDEQMEELTVAELLKSTLDASDESVKSEDGSDGEDPAPEDHEEDKDAYVPEGDAGLSEAEADMPEEDCYMPVSEADPPREEADDKEAGRRSDTSSGAPGDDNNGVSSPKSNSESRLGGEGDNSSMMTPRDNDDISEGEEINPDNQGTDDVGRDADRERDQRLLSTTESRSSSRIEGDKQSLDDGVDGVSMNEKSSIDGEASFKDDNDAENSPVVSHMVGHKRSRSTEGEIPSSTSSTSGRSPVSHKSVMYSAVTSETGDAFSESDNNHVNGQQSITSTKLQRRSNSSRSVHRSDASSPTHTERSLPSSPRADHPSYPYPGDRCRSSRGASPHTDRSSTASSPAPRDRVESSPARSFPQTDRSPRAARRSSTSTSYGDRSLRSSSRAVLGSNFRASAYPDRSSSSRADSPQPQPNLDENTELDGALINQINQAIDGETFFENDKELVEVSDEQSPRAIGGKRVRSHDSTSYGAFDAPSPELQSNVSSQFPEFDAFSAMRGSESGHESVVQDVYNRPTKVRRLDAPAPYGLSTREPIGTQNAAARNGDRVLHHTPEDEYLYSRRSARHNLHPNDMTFSRQGYGQTTTQPFAAGAHTRFAGESFPLPRTRPRASSLENALSSARHAVASRLRPRGKRKVYQDPGSDEEHADESDSSECGNASDSNGSMSDNSSVRHQSGASSSKNRGSPNDSESSSTSDGLHSRKRRKVTTPTGTSTLQRASADSRKFGHNSRVAGAVREHQRTWNSIDAPERADASEMMRTRGSSYSQRQTPYNDDPVMHDPHGKRKSPRTDNVMSDSVRQDAFAGAHDEHSNSRRGVSEEPPSTPPPVFPRVSSSSSASAPDTTPKRTTPSLLSALTKSIRRAETREAAELQRRHHVQPAAAGPYAPSRGGYSEPAADPYPPRGGYNESTTGDPPPSHGGYSATARGFDRSSPPPHAESNGSSTVYSRASYGVTSGRDGHDSGGGRGRGGTAAARVHSTERHVSPKATRRTRFVGVVAE